MNKTCKNCGCINPQSANYCANCGEILSQGEGYSVDSDKVENSGYNVNLISAEGPAKLQIIKLIKYLTGLELKDSILIANNCLTHSDGLTMFYNVDYSKAMKLKSDFENLGAKVKIIPINVNS